MQNFVGKTKYIVGYMKVADRAVRNRVIKPVSPLQRTYQIESVLRSIFVLDSTNGH